MTDFNALYTEVIVTTYEHQATSSWVDNITQDNALLYKIKEKNNSSAGGGYRIKIDLIGTPTSSNYTRYSGLETLPTGETDGLTAATYEWKSLSNSFSISGDDMAQNRGREEIKSLIEGKQKAMRADTANNFVSDMYSDGTADSGKQVGGLQLLVADAGTGTVGNINSSTYSWWQNKVQSAAAPIQGGGAITASATTIESLMNPLYDTLVRGKDKSDLILADPNYFAFYMESQQTKQRYMSGKMAEQGFESIKFRGADVCLDNSDSMPTNHMYFLNTDYIGLKYLKGYDFKVQDPRTPINQDGIVVFEFFKGNMWVSNRARQGVLTA